MKNAKAFIIGRKLILLSLAIFCFSNTVLISAQTKKFTDPIFTVDFVKAKDGEYENYLEFLKLNWAEARVIAKKKKYIKSFQLLILPKDEKSDWHFILITEYGTKKQYDDMEKNFGGIFKQRGVKLVNGKSSRAMADIVIAKEFLSPVWGQGK